MTLFSVIALYLAFRVKQFACDFLLQSDWMATTKGKPGLEGYRALFSHSLVHAMGTGLIVLVFAPGLWWLAAVDFVVHSMVDRLKGIMTFQKGWKSTDRMFWWSFGLDQEAHNLTHMIYILLIVMHNGLAA